MTSTLPARTARKSTRKSAGVAPPAAESVPAPTATADAVEHAIRVRLDDLKAQCAEALAQYTPPGSCGDAADRCANVELAITIEDLQARITELELMLQAPKSLRQPRRAGRKSRPAGSVQVGSQVQLSFDGGRSRETFVLLPHELALGDDEVVTPNSPLGQALQGAVPGVQVSYRAANRTTITVEVIAVDGQEFTPQSAKSA
ncbi:MAG TPA: GreA/GreB family elongation factor [Jatrophihabitans sp.]|jgi:transcription elongation factor GreA|uniref:GreA/GreB family elongation factor n=1 Tax=Jatrophihabitans sp. TaxID=1932789 RepID=UPI002EEDF792